MTKNKNQKQIDSIKSGIKLALTDEDLNNIINNLDTLSDEEISNINSMDLFFVREISTHYNNIGYLLLGDKLYSESVIYLLKSINLRLRLPLDDYHIFTSYSMIKKAFLKTARYGEALECAYKMITFSKKYQCDNWLKKIEKDLVLYRKNLSKVKK